MVRSNFAMHDAVTFIALMLDIMGELKSADDLELVFRRIAKDKSDCSSGQRGGKWLTFVAVSFFISSSQGDLGMFGHGAMQKAFEEASFALNVDEMSKVVDSDSGLHVILRIA